MAIQKSQINNSFYDQLGEDWYRSSNHPVALLRAENRVRIPWVSNTIKSYYQNPIQVLDIGCGAGFLTNALAQDKHTVTGIDLSENSLIIAKSFDKTNSVNYIHADAHALPFKDHTFDVVCAMDILEHTPDPAFLIKEAARVLKPNGLFFFHTFNRNPISYLMVIKGVEWFVKNTPQNMHVYSLFIKPKELDEILAQSNLQIQTLTGFVPKIASVAFWKMLITRKVPENFEFKFTKSVLTGYCGIARSRIKSRNVHT